MIKTSDSISLSSRWVTTETQLQIPLSTKSSLGNCLVNFLENETAIACSSLTK